MAIYKINIKDTSLKGLFFTGIQIIFLKIQIRFFFSIHPHPLPLCFSCHKNKSYSWNNPSPEICIQEATDLFPIHKQVEHSQSINTHLPQKRGRKESNVPSPR